MASDVRDLRLPADLCNDVERRVGSRFDSLEQFIIFILHELLRDEAVQMDQAEQRIIEQRLKDLGYM